MATPPERGRSGPRPEPPPVLTARRAAAAAALLAAIVDLNALPGAFLGDDFAVVVENPLVAQVDVARIFSSDYWGPGGGSGLYRPLTVLTYALNRLAFGAAPWSYHLVNVALHAGTAFLFASILSALGLVPALALAAAALFAAHPVHADLVNIVVGRADLLVAALVFGALRLALAGRRRWWPAVLALYLAALLSKEHAVAFLPLLVGAGALAGPGPREVWHRDRWLYALSAGLTALWLLARSRVLAAGDATPLLVYATDNPLHGASPISRLLGAAKVNLWYLGNLLAPVRLQSVYAGPAMRALVAPSAWSAIVAAAWAAALAGAASWTFPRRAPCAFGLLLWAAGFAATGNFLFTISVLAADRFAYLPVAGLSVCAAWLLLLPARAMRGRRGARALLLLPAACVLALAWLTVGRNAAFRDPQGFWRSVTALDPGNVRAWYFLAQAAHAAGRLDAAEEALRRAADADPSFPDALIGLSLVLLERGRPAEAAEAARQAIASAPHAAGMAQLALARAQLALGSPAEALGLLDEAAPMLGGTFDWSIAHAGALEALGALEEASASYRAALAVREDAAARAALARVLGRLGRPAEALETLRRDAPPP